MQPIGCESRLITSWGQTGVRLGSDMCLTPTVGSWHFLQTDIALYDTTTWDDDRSIAILRSIRAAMNAAGRVILLESVLPAANVADLGKVIDLEMVVMTGGRERTADEFRRLFDRAGFTLTRVIPTKSPLSVIEAR